MLRLGTRGSALALWQARTVAQLIAQAGGPACEIVTIKTSGDRLQEAPLSDVGGKRLFVKEIEDALLRHDIDLAVHSSKDMPALLPDGLAIAAVLEREDPLDAVVLPRREGAPASPLTDASSLVARLGAAPSIGTSSVRRVAQLLRLFPNARFTPIRGNLDTRLRKLDAGEYDMLVLAAAGLRRLGWSDRISLTLDAATCVPAPGQGIVAIEIRIGDARTYEAVAAINNPLAAAALVAERAVVERLGGGCQTPIGALAVPAGADDLELVGAVVALDGSRAVRASLRGRRSDAAIIGIQVAERLLASGASDILDEVRRAQAGLPQH
ncbi:MAG: hydroxymethylbilane synthase [Acidobacteriaceae bacterium]|jgi:hydroxymethylbilane synthase|nr:hydroxymethylbilane synthase [Acidobacteriaceae bacterium]